MKSTCGKCGLVFTSVSSFDMHRVGKFEPLERRCLTVEEMKAKKMTLNGLGRWTTGGSFDTTVFSKKDIA